MQGITVDSPAILLVILSIVPHAGVPFGEDIMHFLTC